MNECFKCKKEIVLAYRTVDLCSECATEICGTQPIAYNTQRDEICKVNDCHKCRHSDSPDCSMDSYEPI